MCSRSISVTGRELRETEARRAVRRAPREWGWGETKATRFLPWPLSKRGELAGGGSLPGEALPCPNLGKQDEGQSVCFAQGLFYCCLECGHSCSALCIQCYSFRMYPVLMFTSLTPVWPRVGLSTRLSEVSVDLAHASQPAWNVPFAALPQLTSLAGLVFTEPGDNIFRFHLEFPGQLPSKPLRKFRKEGHGNVRRFSTELGLSKWSWDDVYRLHWADVTGW